MNSQEQKDKAVEIALQKLCEEHNGKIIIERIKNSGTRVKINLKIGKE